MLSRKTLFAQNKQNVGFLLRSKISFYGTALILIILILVLSLKFNKKTEEKINNEVSNEYIASYFDGEYQTEIPGKDDGYVVDKIVCDNGATATWDNEEWGINIRNATQKVKCSIYFKFQFKQEFDYTGTEQVFTAPKAGTYKLETWGAQGATDSTEKYGGYGGYSKGIVSLKENQKLYIFVGEKGKNINSSVSTGTISSYPNGGAITLITTDDNNITFSSGGGSTHIASKNKLISELSSDLQSLYIVSGGGGGSCGWWVNNGVSFGDNGGNGGGYVGGTTKINFPNNGVLNNNPGGGTQIIGGTGGGNLDGGSPTSYLNGVFGMGGGTNVNYNVSTKVHISGSGGGGYYGGGASWGGSGAGGSGYIGNSLLTDKAMYCYNCEESSEESTKTISITCTEETPTENCAKKGNGYVKITYLG